MHHLNHLSYPSWKTRDSLGSKSPKGAHCRRDDTSDMTPSPGNLPEQPASLCFKEKPPDVRTGKGLVTQWVLIGSGATNLGDGLAHSIAGLVTDPPSPAWEELATQDLEPLRMDLCGSTWILYSASRPKQQVFLHNGGVYAVTVNEESLEGPEGEVRERRAQESEGKNTDPHTRDQALQLQHPK